MKMKNRIYESGKDDKTIHQLWQHSLRDLRPISSGLLGEQAEGIGNIIEELQLLKLELQ